MNNVTSGGVNYSLRRTYANWAILLLPHLHQEDVATMFDQSLPVTDPRNAHGRTAELAVMKCPSDRYSNADAPYRLSPTQGPKSAFARGNYAINGGVSDLAYAPGMPWNPAPNGTIQKYTGTIEEPVERIWGSGVAGFNKSFSVQEFENGLSNLVGIDEVRAGLTSDDCRGAWALGLAGASLTWGHGLIGDASGPNCRHPRSDDITGCNQLHEAFGEEALVREGMPCCPYATSEQAAARSMHPGGVNALMMDGSARFFVDDVDLSVWHAIHSRQTREVAVPTDCDQPVVTGEASASSEPVYPPPDGIESVTNSIGMTLLRIPAGEFIMGLPDSGSDHNDPITGVPPDVPPHRVRITRDFYLGAFEVTRGQWERIMGKNPSWHSMHGQDAADAARSQLPAAQISWVDAVAFCCRLCALPAEKAAGRRYRLPTEAEWEYGCRAGSTTPLQVLGGNSGFNMRPDAHKGLPIGPVGSYSPNEFGLYDMRGNVFEWCADWFAWDYYLHSPRRDPLGPSSGVLRVVRGADWRFTNMGCHYTRFDTEPWWSSPYIGFRVVCEKDEWESR
ncbi:MAG: SUMF1/EgtB/PvdO family nonheme iron enzyme [Planctomycetes bacterium]|nr:SUMF1/EgtB/PvdO family nonheme iron enzyme [Planctomycetota bacterium]